jgi:hypothetical protein
MSIALSRGSQTGVSEADMKILVAFTLLALAVSRVDASQQADEDEIRTIQAGWDDAWNRHDIKALSALVAEDVRFVNVAGVVLNGRTSSRNYRRERTQPSSRTVCGPSRAPTSSFSAPILRLPTSDGV